jgi:predicted dehydrogenase
MRIGCVGAGMILAECHLAAYKEADFPGVAIGSCTKANAAKVAERWGVPRVRETPESVIEDRDVEIVDLAFPPDQQPDLIRHALKQAHVRPSSRKSRWGCRSKALNYGLHLKRLSESIRTFP